MQSIGERLEEARKRRGISIREASEATKIRGDFLLSFENNQFEVGLPEIYVRGFLRNYSGFLRIDPDKIVTDFNATLLAEAKVARKESRELFGRMELPERPRQPKEPAQGGEAAGGTSPARRRVDETEEAAREPVGPDLMLYAKIGGIIVAGILAVLLIVLLVLGIIRAGSSPGTGVTETGTEAGTPISLETVTLIALDNVRVEVVQVSDNRTLFEGPLARGERHTIQKSGRITIRYTAGSNLRIEKDGREYRMPIDGPGRSHFD